MGEASRKRGSQRTPDPCGELSALRSRIRLQQVSWVPERSLRRFLWLCGEAAMRTGL